MSMRFAQERGLANQFLLQQLLYMYHLLTIWHRRVINNDEEM